MADCDTPTVCCDGFFTLADSLRECLYERLVFCWPDECNELRTWVSHGEPIGPGNYVVTWIDRVRPEVTPNQRAIVAPKLQVLIGVVVQVPWPGLSMQGGAPALAPPDEYRNAAMISLSLMEQTYRGIEACVREIDGCSLAYTDDVVSRAPQGYNARWVFTASMSTTLNQLRTMSP